MFKVRTRELTEDHRHLQRYARTGDADAFRVVADRYLDFVFTVCKQNLQHAQAAEDATQETFIALARQARRLRPDTVLPSWLYAVALTKCKDSRRKVARQKRTEAPQQAPNQSPDEGLTLHMALASLAPREREVVILRVLLECSYTEMAQHLGVSEDAARMRTDRALKRLRENLTLAAGFRWNQEKAPFTAQDLKIPKRPKPNWQPSALLVGTLFVAGVSVRTIGANHPDADKATESSLALSTNKSNRSVANAPNWLPLYAKVTIRQDDNNLFQGETWRTDAVARWIQPSPRGTIHAELKNGAVKSMVTGITVDGSVGAIVIAAPERRVVEIDALEACLIQVPTYLYSRKPLPLVPFPGKSEPNPATLESHGRTYKIWFDPSHSNRASKVDFRYSGHHITTSVKTWQVVDGVDFPATLAQEVWFNDEKSPSRQITISGIKIGKKAPAPPAMPKPDRGAMVMDERRQVIYRVDENWKRISEEQKVGDGDIGS